MRAINWLFFLLTISVAQAQVNFANYTSVDGLSSTCVQVLNQQVACDPSILYAGKDGKYESDDTLNLLCTTGCSSALSTYMRRVTGACGTDRYLARDGFEYLPAYNVEGIVERYQTLCLQSSSGQFCNAVIRDLVGIDPSNQHSTASPSPGLSCNTCVLSLMQTELALPLSSNPDLSTIFSSLTSSCGVTGLSLTPPASTAWSIPATSTSSSPTPTPTCAGNSYTIQTGDICQSVSLSQKLGTVRLLAANDLLAWCANFPTSGSLCIPDEYVCAPYQVKQLDTCDSIAAANNISWTQVISWNPELGTRCENIASYTGYTLCVSNPGGSWIDPNPTSTTSTTTTTTDTIFTLSMTPMDSFPTPTFVPMNSTANPIANGTRGDCSAYLQAPLLINVDTNATTLACSDAASAYGVALADFITWNPSLSTDACQMTAGYQYCAQRLPVQASNMTSSCVQFAVAQPPLSCRDFTARYGIEPRVFGDWNPAVGSNCDNFNTGMTYCVAVRHFKPSGYVSTCNLFAMANNTDYWSFPCQIIETQFGLSHGRFVAWNPTVLDNCTGIAPYYDYCVSIPGYRPTYTSTTPYSPPTTTPTPTPSVKLLANSTDTYASTSRVKKGK